MISQRSKCHILRTQGLKDTVICIGCFASWFPEVGIYKRKQESKKTGKHAFNKESNQEEKKRRKKTRSRPRKWSRKKKENKNSTKKATKKKKKKLSFILDTFFFEFLFPLFLYFFLVFLFSYFLVLFYKFPPLFIYDHFTGWSVKFAFFQERSQPLPPQHFATIGCSKNGQLVGVTVHKHYV